jgi:DNA-binding GntR family transcriptional regulator
MPQIGEIQVKSRREHVLDALRDAILDGEFKPGDSLIESDLASKLKVSRAPLREALQILTAEGLVETVPYHGSTVRMLTPKDVEELYSLRGALEAFAIERIIERADPHAQAELHARYEAMREAASAGDMRRVTSEDQKFHTTLIALSDHAMLLSMWNLVRNRVRQVMALRNQQNRDVVQVADNHAPIIEAIIARDARLATELIYKHVASAADLVLENWQYEGQEREK